MFRSIYSSFTRRSFLSVTNVGQTLFSKNCSNGRPLIEKGLNQVILMGRCGSDAQLRGSDTKSVVIFSLATHSHFKSQETDQYQQKTDWHRISIFKNRLQERSLSFAKKGCRLLVQGRISYGEITDSNGVTHQTTSIIADDIVFLSSSRALADKEVESEEVLEA